MCNVAGDVMVIGSLRIHNNGEKVLSFSGCGGYEAALFLCVKERKNI